MYHTMPVHGVVPRKYLQLQETRPRKKNTERRYMYAEKRCIIFYMLLLYNIIPKKVYLIF